MAGMETAEMVLQQMQMLDQQVAAALALTQQRRDLGKRRGIDLAALRLIRPAPPPRAGMDAAVVAAMRLHVALLRPLSGIAGEGGAPRTAAAG